MASWNLSSRCTPGRGWKRSPSAVRVRTSLELTATVALLPQEGERWRHLRFDSAPSREALAFGVVGSKLMLQTVSPPIGPSGPPHSTAPSLWLLHPHHCTLRWLRGSSRGTQKTPPCWGTCSRQGDTTHSLPGTRCTPAGSVSTATVAPSQTHRFLHAEEPTETASQWSLRLDWHLSLKR